MTQRGWRVRDDVDGEDDNRMPSAQAGNLACVEIVKKWAESRTGLMISPPPLTQSLIQQGFRRGQNPGSIRKIRKQKRATK